MRAVLVSVVGGLLVSGLLAGAGVATAQSTSNATPVVDLLPGRGDGRAEITANGRHAIVHQGSSYGPEAMLKVDLTADPPRMVGQMALAADTNSELALVKNRFAYATARNWMHSPGTHLLVLKVRKNGKPRLVRRIKVTATDLAVSRNGKRLVAVAGKRRTSSTSPSPRGPAGSASRSRSRGRNSWPLRSGGPPESSTP